MAVKHVPKHSVYIPDYSTMKAETWGFWEVPRDFFSRKFVSNSSCSIFGTWWTFHRIFVQNMSFVICISGCFFTRNIQTTGHLQDQGNKNKTTTIISAIFFWPKDCGVLVFNRWQKVMFNGPHGQHFFPKQRIKEHQWTSSSKNKCLVTALVGSIHHHHLKPWHAGHARFRGSDRFVARLFQRYPETLIKIACWNPVQHWRGPLWKIILTNKVQWFFVSFCYV